MMTEIYVSTDVEADGKIPGENSMLSFASAAYTAEKKLVSTFSANLRQLPNATPDPNTMTWWETQPEAWAECRRDQQDPAIAMPKYAEWLKSLDGELVFVGYPAAYDFMFVYWYMIVFAKESLFEHRALDIRSYAMSLLNTTFYGTSKKSMPAEWFDPLPHTHKALDDAIAQGALFCNMLAWNNARV